MVKKDARVIALGFFDGVHLGHAALLSRTVDIAKEQGMRACALTFDSQPEAHITRTSVPLLGTINERAELMRRLFGIEEVIFAHFDENIMRMTWDTFLRSMLYEQFSAGHVVAGHDFHFGYKAEGNPKRLSEGCRELGLGCTIVDKVELDGITVSSTYIRKLVAQGDMERAMRFLGHPHVVSGVVNRGSRLGTSYGVPTVNLNMPEGVQVPAQGVYITQTVFGGRTHPSITNVGIRPTVTLGGKIVVETSLLRYDGDLYGENLRVEFLRYIRPELTFPSMDALKVQIRTDIKEAEIYHRQKGAL